jgi:4-hydroxybenzoate polyprenyltransferase
VVGALASGILAVKITNTSPTWAWWVVLGLAVWFVYTADHLLDALRGNPDHLSKRHKFHFENKNHIILALFLAALISVILAFVFLDTKIIVFGFILGGTVLLYQFILVISGKIKSIVQKEIVVALIYIAGIWGGPLILQDSNISLEQWLVMISLFLLAASDLLILSIYDEELDYKAGFKSFAVQFGQKITGGLVSSLLLSAISIGIFLIFTTGDKVFNITGIILVIMGLVLGSMQVFTSFYGKNNRIRYFNEIVFWLPALVVFYG